MHFNPAPHDHRMTFPSSDQTYVHSRCPSGTERKEIMRITIIAILTLCFSISAMAQTPATTPVPQAPQAHPLAITYSHGYEVRSKIHKYASLATLPLFATEFYLGQSMYHNPSTADSRRSLHAAVGTGIISLAGINTVTGGWNMWESRKDTQGRTLRLAHGLLMMASDAGFVATAATGPHRTRGASTPASAFSSNAAMHRDLAIGSISVGTAGYLLMLLAHH